MKLLIGPLLKFIEAVELLMYLQIMMVKQTFRAADPMIHM